MWRAIYEQFSGNETRPPIQTHLEDARNRVDDTTVSALADATNVIVGTARPFSKTQTPSGSREAIPNQPMVEYHAGGFRDKENTSTGRPDAVRTGVEDLRRKTCSTDISSNYLLSENTKHEATPESPVTDSQGVSIDQLWASLGLDTSTSSNHKRPLPTSTRDEFPGISDFVLIIDR